MTPDKAKSIALEAVRYKPEKITSLCCNCTGTVTLTRIGEWEHCLLSDSRHTWFSILVCNRCHRIYGFPHDNLLIAIHHGTDETIRDLSKLIIRQANETWLSRLFTVPKFFWQAITGKL